MTVSEPCWTSLSLRDIEFLDPEAQAYRMLLLAFLALVAQIQFLRRLGPVVRVALRERAEARHLPEEAPLPHRQGASLLSLAHPVYDVRRVLPALRAEPVLGLWNLHTFTYFTRMQSCLPPCIPTQT